MELQLLLLREAFGVVLEKSEVGVHEDYWLMGVQVEKALVHSSAIAAAVTGSAAGKKGEIITEAMSAMRQLIGVQAVGVGFGRR